jgi:transcriptional regulator with XRE-family HTH domain
MGENRVFSIKLGKKLRDIRKSRGFSQESLANELEIDRSYVGRIERGEKNISIVMLRKILNILDISLTDFFKDLE